MTDEHVNCGGNLVHHHTEKTKLKNGKILEKEFFQCDKCHDILQVIVFPSYEDYVLMGQIRVAYPELKRIRDLYEQRQKRLEERANEQS